MLLTALALVPSAAHLFELPHKIRLPEQQYFVVQGIYRGWALFGAVLIAAALVNLILGAALHRRRERAWPASSLPGLLVALTIAVFFLDRSGQPPTAITTTIPADSRRLRAEWEYSHAANAILTLAALCLAALAAIGPRDDGGAAASRRNAISDRG